jgi:hypothetical protein
MPTVDDNNPKLARIYDSSLDKWVPLMGVPSPHSHPISGGSVTGLSDVLITNPQNGQVLKYNSALGKWTNQNP